MENCHKTSRCTKWISNVVCEVMGAETRALQCNFDRTICKLCDINRKVVTLHVLSECPSFNDVCRNGWMDMAIIMPDAMGRHVDTFPAEKLQSISFGLGRNYINEWKLITVILPNFSYIYILKKYIVFKVPHELHTLDTTGYCGVWWTWNTLYICFLAVWNKQTDSCETWNLA